MPTRTVKGKTADLSYTVVGEAVPGGKVRTVRIEGPVRNVSGRASHSGDGLTAWDHRGHLIADRFGGPGRASSGNIVAMHGHQNGGAGEYGGMEREVAKLLADQTGYMTVEVGYDGPAATRPHVFHVTLVVGGNPPRRWEIYNFGWYMPDPNATAG